MKGKVRYDNKELTRIDEGDSLVDGFRLLFLLFLLALCLLWGHGGPEQEWWTDKNKD